MNKHLLLGTALLVAISAFPQNGRTRPSPSGVALMTPKKLDYNESSTQNVVTVDVPKKEIKHVRNAGAAKTTGSIASNIFTGSMNVFGYLISQSRPLQYNKGVDAVTFIGRKSNTYVPSANSSSGVIVGSITYNLGTTWDYNCLYSHATNLGRYPNGGIFNPSGNTNPTNAYLVACGRITGGSGWLGDFYASKQIPAVGTNAPGSDMQSELDATPTMKKHTSSSYAFTAIDGGLCRSMASIANDPNATTNAAYKLRGAAMVKGVFSAGAFVWSVDSFIPPVNTYTAGFNVLAGSPLQAWDNAGINGYVIQIGSRAGTTGQMKGYQPIVYKTTNSGASWSLLPPNDFADYANFRGVNDRLFATNANTTIVCPNFSGSEGMGAAVDVNGQLHLASMVYGHTSTYTDSLGYYSQWGAEKLSWPENTKYGFCTIYDFYTKPFGGWDYIIVDSMGTEGPSGTSGYPGYASNLWSDGSGAKMDQDARLQMSRTTDGKKLFFSWTESDTTIAAPLKWNIYPEIMWKGYDVTIQKVTPRMNATTLDPNVDQLAYYHYMCNTAVGASSVCMTMPFTVTKNAYNGANPVDTYFLGDQVCPSSFTVNTLHPTGVATTNNTTVNFDVFNYPNPANEATTIIIGLKKAENFEVTLYSSVGQVLNTYKINGQLGANEINLDLTSYSAGVYFYNVKVGSSVVTKKLIVQ